MQETGGNSSSFHVEGGTSSPYLEEEKDTSIVPDQETTGFPRRRVEPYGKNTVPKSTDVDKNVAECAKGTC